VFAAVATITPSTKIVTLPVTNLARKIFPYRRYQRALNISGGTASRRTSAIVTRASRAVTARFGVVKDTAEGLADRPAHRTGGVRRFRWQRQEVFGLDSLEDRSERNRLGRADMLNVRWSRYRV